MNKCLPPKRQGFTVVEMVVASSILMVTLAMAFAGFAYFLSETKKAEVQNKLDIDVQVAIEQIRRNLRLTSLDKMFFHPAGVGPYTAMSFPLARDIDGDGAVDVDGSGNVIWDRTLVYHVWTGMPTQLRLTTFQPRNNSLTDAQRQAQIDAVVLGGNGGTALNGSNAQTKVIFENVFTWAVRPRSATFDGYAPELSRDRNVSLGSIVISNGVQTFSFTTIGTNKLSSGYRIGIDTLTVSPSAGAREAEAQLPVVAQNGASASSQYMAQGSWSGNYQLAFPATGIGQGFTLAMENDRWEETNFRSTGETHANSTVNFTSTSPNDFVVTLEGWDRTWDASRQTGDTAINSTALDALAGTAIRILVRGSSMDEGNWILFNGQRCYIGLRAGSAPLRILNAYIAEAASSDAVTMDAKAGTMTTVSFGGSAGVFLSAYSFQWSSQINLPIDKTKSYVITLLVSGTAGEGTARQWLNTVSPGVPSTYTIPASSAPTATIAQDLNWSSRGDVTSSDSVIALETVWATYPTNGIFTSAIYDTTLGAPVYRTIGWNQTLLSGTSIRMKVRTGDNEDLSDASAWSAISDMTSPGSISPGSRRYVQFQANLLASADLLRSPLLRDTTIRWDGPAKMVDIGGTFTKGPNYGIFEVKVNNQALKQGVVVDLEIFDTVRSHGGQVRITSALATEVTPRNSGR